MAPDIQDTPLRKQVETPVLPDSFRADSSLADLLKSDCHSPCASHQHAPCDQDEPCQDTASSSKTGNKLNGFWYRLFYQGWQNTINIAFDEVYKEPKKILMIGGCRQREFARHIALMLPGSDITLIDPCDRHTQLAKEEVCCRFKFVTSQVESMPFDNGQFDLVLAHNVMEFCNDWQASHAEIQRVTSRNQGNIMLSVPDENLLGLFSLIPGFKAGLSQTGVVPSSQSGSYQAVKASLARTNQAKITLELSPFPWKWLVASLA